MLSNLGHELCVAMEIDFNGRSTQYSNKRTNSMLVFFLHI